MIFYLIVANFVMFISFFFKLNKLPPEIPLFYSKASGDSQIADWWLIFLIPASLPFTTALLITLGSDEGKAMINCSTR